MPLNKAIPYRLHSLFFSLACGSCLHNMSVFNCYNLINPESCCWLYLYLYLCFRMMSELSEWFWQERLWFPKGLGWADLEDRDGRVYAKARDLWVALPIALIFLIVRQIFERSVHFSLCLTRYLYIFLRPSVQSNFCLFPLTAAVSFFSFSFGLPISPSSDR